MIKFLRYAFPAGKSNHARQCDGLVFTIGSAGGQEGNDVQKTGLHSTWFGMCAVSIDRGSGNK